MERVYVSVFLEEKRQWILNVGAKRSSCNRRQFINVVMFHHIETLLTSYRGGIEPDKLFHQDSWWNNFAFLESRNYPYRSMFHNNVNS